MNPALPAAQGDARYTRRVFMLMRATRRGAPYEQAATAVDNAIAANPKWDTDEQHTYMEWEAKLR